MSPRRDLRLEAVPEPGVQTAAWQVKRDRTLFIFAAGCRTYGAPGRIPCRLCDRAYIFATEMRGSSGIDPYQDLAGQRRPQGSILHA